MKRSDAVPGEVFSECASGNSDDEQLKSPPEDIVVPPPEVTDVNRDGKMEETPVHSGEQHQITTPILDAIVEGYDGGEQDLFDSAGNDASPTPSQKSSLTTVSVLQMYHQL